MRSIIIITPSYGDDNNAASRRINGFLKSFSDSSIKTEIIASSGHIPKQKDLVCSKTLISLKKNNSKLLFRLFYEMLWGIEILFRVSLKSRKDVLLVTTPPFISFLCYSLFLSKKRKIIIDVRDIYPQMFKYLNYVDENSFFYKLLNYLTIKVYKKAHCIITATNGLRNEIIQTAEFLNPKPILNGFPTDLLEIKNKGKSGKFQVCFHGTLGRLQNINLLAELIKHYAYSNEIQFLIIGTGSDADIISTLNYDNLEYYSDLPYDEMFLKISESDLGLSFRIDKLSETALPVKIFEYFGLDVPILFTPKEGEINNVFRGYKNIIGVNNNLEEIISIIEDRLKKSTVKKHTFFDKHKFSRDFQNKSLIKIVGNL